MKAAVLYNTGDPLILEDDIVVPRLKTGPVLVQLTYSGGCRSQLMEFREFRSEDRYLLHILEYEESELDVPSAHRDQSTSMQRFSI